MLEGFLDTIKGIGIFIICAQAIVHFRPKASYEKYIKVLVSIIVLTMLIVPCFQLMGDAETFLCSMEQYDSFLSGDTRAVWGNSVLWSNGERTEGEAKKENFGSLSEADEDTDSQKIKIKSTFNIEEIQIAPVEVIE